MGDSEALGNTTAMDGVSPLEPTQQGVMVNVTLQFYRPKGYLNTLEQPFAATKLK